MQPLTIKEILRGCEVGRIQTVGVMQVIPLILDEDLQDDRFENPDVVRVGTRNYGEMVFSNPSGKPVLLPTHVGYVVKQAAQDHAMATAGIVPPKGREVWDNAMCIQATQGGYIREDQHKMLILPLALRRPALEKRKDRRYNKLWQSIGSFSAQSGMSSTQNLVQYMQQFAEELDQFIAEFEIVDNQVGAIILISGNVVGVERAPSAAYWKSVWEPLVRVCYGSAAIMASRQKQDADKVLKTRTPLQVDDLTNMDALCDALESADQQQDELVRKQVRDLLDTPFHKETEQGRSTVARLTTIRNDQFFGQIASDTNTDSILYASMVMSEGWDPRKGWKLTRAFQI